MPLVVQPAAADLARAAPKPAQQEQEGKPSQGPRPIAGPGRARHHQARKMRKKKGREERSGSLDPLLSPSPPPCLQTFKPSVRARRCRPKSSWPTVRVRLSYRGKPSSARLGSRA